MILFSFVEGVDYVVEGITAIGSFFGYAIDFVNMIFSIFPAPFDTMLKVTFTLIFAIALFKLFKGKG